MAGAVCIPTLPISLYPDLAPPQVTVTSNYVGANAQVVESAVTIPLEQQINGVEGMHYITSTSSNDGTSNINVTFRTGYDLNIAAVDVQNRVATAQGRLPQEIKNTGVTITKANPNFVFAAGFFSPDNSLSNQYISNYLDVYVKDALKRIPGVGDVVIFGERKYAMRIWLDPTKLAARQLTAADVVSALQEQNVEIPAGQLGRPPPIRSRTFRSRCAWSDAFRIRRSSRTSFSRTRRNGIVQLKDVGRAEIGAESYDTNLLYSGHEAIGVGVQQLSNANALEVDKAAKAALDRAFEIVSSGHQVRDRVRHHHGGRRFGEGSGDHAGRSGHHRYHRDLLLPAGLARDHHSGGHDSGVADRHVCFHQDLWLLDQFADAVRHHAGDRPGGRRRDRGHRECAAPHQRGQHRSAYRHLGGHARGDERGGRDFAGADFGVRAGVVLPGHDRNSLPAVLADDCLLDCDLAVQRADAVAGAGGHSAARRRTQVFGFRLDAHRLALAAVTGKSRTGLTTRFMAVGKRYGKAISQGAELSATS